MGREVGHGPPPPPTSRVELNKEALHHQPLIGHIAISQEKASFFFTIESNCPNTDLSKGGDDQTKMVGRGFNLFHANHRNQKLATVNSTNAQRFPFAR